MLHWWSDEDRQILIKLYPSATKEKILETLNKKFKTKTWSAIQKEASRLKIKRKVKYNKGGRPRKKVKNFIGKKQLSALLEKDLTIQEIAEKLRTTPDIVRRYIFKYEL